MKIANCLGALILAATLLGALVNTAEARRRHYDQDYYAEPYYHGRSAIVCQKMCEQDFSPCDPIYFKTADGRCASVRTR
jgi:hypothetical protein